MCIIGPISEQTVSLFYPWHLRGGSDVLSLVYPWPLFKYTQTDEGKDHKPLFKMSLL